LPQRKMKLEAVSDPRAASLPSARSWQSRRPCRSFVIATSNSDEAIHPAPCGDMDCFAEPVIGPRSARTRWLAMTVFLMSNRSRGARAPEPCEISVPPNRRAQGRPDAGCTRGKCAEDNHRCNRSDPAFPAQRFTAYTRSPRGIGLLAPVAFGITPEDLMPASGHQDHAISPSASASARQPQPKRPSLPASTSVTTRPPLLAEPGWRQD
jgi:hypothetical protein